MGGQHDHSDNLSSRDIHRGNGLRCLLSVCIQHLEAEIVATVNIDLSADWVKIAEDTDDPFCAQCITNCIAEVAAVATDTDPTVSGMRLIGNDGPNPMAVSRNTHPTGFVFAKILSGPAAAVMVVNT